MITFWSEKFFGIVCPLPHCPSTVHHRQADHRPFNTVTSVLCQSCAQHPSVRPPSHRLHAPVSSSTMSALRDPAANKIRVKSISFDCEPPRSSYKTLFLGTSLGAALSRMSTEKVAPVRLKNQECERGRGGEKAPIRYVPDRDPVQEALDLKPETLKCTLTNGLDI